jgi:hypothetical protein
MIVCRALQPSSKAPVCRWALEAAGADRQNETEGLRAQLSAEESTPEPLPRGRQGVGGFVPLP